MLRMRRTTSLSISTPKAKWICSAIRGQPQLGLRCFISTTALISSRLGPFGPGALVMLRRKQNAVLLHDQQMMKAQQCRGFDDDGGTQHTSRAQEEGT